MYSYPISQKYTSCENRTKSLITITKRQKISHNDSIMAYFRKKQYDELTVITVIPQAAGIAE